MHTGMNDQSRAKVCQSLAKLLADTYALYLKTQTCHWNISGPEFFELHLLFEKQYSEMAEAIDEIAERIRALGLYVEGGLSAFKQLTSVVEETKVLTDQEMLQQLVEAQEVVVRQARKTCQVAEEEKDGATVDLASRRLGVHEKSGWMLRSSL